MPMIVPNARFTSLRPQYKFDKFGIDNRGVLLIVRFFHFMRELVRVFSFYMLIIFNLCVNDYAQSIKNS